MAAIPAGVSEWGGTAQGETLRETETETQGGREGQQGGGQSDSEEGRGGLGAEVSATVGRQTRLRVDGQEVEAAGVSRDLGVALRAGPIEESGIEEEKPEGDISSRGW